MVQQPRKRIKYLNNADMLVEIHKSKMSFSSNTLPEHFDYDIVVHDIREITSQTLDDGVTKRIKRLKSEVLRVVQKKHNCTPKNAHTHIAPNVFEEIEKATVTDVVIRVMTNEHIPEEVLNDKAQKLNFKPFKHYAIDADNN